MMDHVYFWIEAVNVEELQLMMVVFVMMVPLVQLMLLFLDMNVVEVSSVW